MKYYFDRESLLARARTEIKNEEGKLMYWGIYDFSYKWRIRIFDENSLEIGYVQYRIGDDEHIDLCGAIENSFTADEMKNILNDSIMIDEGYLEAEDDELLEHVYRLFAYAQYLHTTGERQ